MGLFSNTAINRGIAALFERKVAKKDLHPEKAVASDTKGSKDAKDEPDLKSDSAKGSTEDVNNGKDDVPEVAKEDLEDAYVKKTARVESKLKPQADENEDSISMASEDQEEVDDVDDVDDVEDVGDVDDDVDDDVDEHLGDEVDDADEVNDSVHKPADATNDGKDRNAADLERTLFVKNVPYSVITDRKVQKMFRAAFGPGIKSVRFRSIPLGEIVPRRVGFIKQKLNSTRDAVNSYIVYDSAERVREALDKMNGFEFEDHHLFVDSAAKPRVRVPKRSVFIGNLSFDATEENLFRIFADVGKIENLRIVRDRKFNIGKGFAYIQFEDVSTVQLALMKNNTECEGRKLRVVRCSKNATSTQEKPKKSFKQKQTKRSRTGNPKADKQAAGKVLEGERSRPGETSILGRKRKPRHENGRNKRVRKNK